MCGREWVWASIFASKGGKHPVAPTIGDCGRTAPTSPGGDDDPNANIAGLPKCERSGKEFSVAQVWRDFLSDYSFFDSSGNENPEYSHRLMELVSSTYARRTTGYVGEAEDFDWREKLIEKYTSTLAGAWAPKDYRKKRVWSDPAWSADDHPMRPNAENKAFWEHEAFGDGGLTRSACNKILCPGIGFNCGDVD